MSKISDAMLETSLEEITDYLYVTLNESEISKLQEICDQWEDKESIETEINKFIQTIGYTFDMDDCLWVR